MHALRKNTRSEVHSLHSQEDDALAVHVLFHDGAPEIAHWAPTTRSLMYARQALVEVCPVDDWPAVASSLGPSSEGARRTAS